ncbi:MAG: cysteine--tRNA ligase [Patescibacteria group bacterium]
MDVKLFNTLTGEVEKLAPLHDREIRMYHCGPTVYDYAHIGNLRTFITNDLLRRTLEYSNYMVKQVMNITDIDDKIIARSREEGTTMGDLTRRYENLFLADLAHLNIKTPHALPRATDHVGGMVALIEKLLRDEYAYTTPNGVYFDIKKSKGYGALARLDLSAETQSRIETDEYEKKDPRDFALWKFWTEDDGENVFAASFGRGRPGWHVECSAMALAELGETLDIHTGGVDLIFPHHTNEIAQSEAATGKLFSKLWLHEEFLTVDGQKMSKSLGNFTTLKMVIEHSIDPLAFRYWTLTAHYRSKANFTWEALEGAQTALGRLKTHLGTESGIIHAEYRARFAEIIANDLDTPRALALAWEVAKSEALSPADKTATLLDFDRALGLQLSINEPKYIVVPPEIQTLLTARKEARLTKNWSRSDELRANIQALGYDVIDTGEEQKVSKLIHK